MSKQKINMYEKCLGLNYSLFPNGREIKRMLGLRSLLCVRKVADLRILFSILTDNLHIEHFSFFRYEVVRTKGLS